MTLGVMVLPATIPFLSHSHPISQKILPPTPQWIQAQSPCPPSRLLLREALAAWARGGLPASTCAPSPLTLSPAARPML